MKNVKFSKKVEKAYYHYQGYQVISDVSKLGLEEVVITNSYGKIFVVFKYELEGQVFENEYKEHFYKVNDAKAYVQSEKFESDVKNEIENKQKELDDKKVREQKFDEYQKNFYDDVKEKCVGFMAKSKDYKVGDKVELFENGLKFGSLDGMVSDLRYFEDRLDYSNVVDVVEVVELSNEVYDEWLKNDLYNDDLFKMENCGENYKDGVIVVKSDNRPNGFIDTQGYEYARYVSFEVENFKALMTFREQNYIKFW